MSNVEIGTYVPEQKVFEGNEYTAPVQAAAAQDAEYKAAGDKTQATVVITVPTEDAAKHATRFAKAANAEGHGARKREVTEDAKAGTTTLVYTLGKLRTPKTATAEVPEAE